MAVVLNGLVDYNLRAVVQEDSTAYTVKCNIDNETNHLAEGIKLALKDDREKNSDKLGSLAKFTGSSTITGLSPYLTVQMVRFFYKVQAAQKAKILRKVGLMTQLQHYESCWHDNMILP